MESTTFKVNKEMQIDKLINKLNSTGMTVETKVEKVGNLTSLLIEKYYMRNSNVACCSVSIYSHSPVEHDIIVMSGGAAQGMFVKFSLGANSEFLDTVCSVIKSM